MARGRKDHRLQARASPRVARRRARDLTSGARDRRRGAVRPRDQTRRDLHLWARGRRQRARRPPRRLVLRGARFSSRGPGRSVSRSGRAAHRAPAVLRCVAAAARSAVRRDDADAYGRDPRVPGPEGAGLRVPQDAVQGPRPVLSDARAARRQGVLPPRDRSRSHDARPRRPPGLMDTILTLPLVLAVVLVELALGGTFVSWFLERRGEAPGGFVKLVAGVDAIAAAAALGLAPTLPRGEAALRVGLHPGALSSLGQALALVAILMTAQLAFTFVPAGVLALAVATFARTAQAPTDMFGLALAFAVAPLGALALGGLDGAMLLGHWYLVTPKLPTAPLRNASLIVVTAVVLQLVVVLATVMRGDLAGTTQTGLVVAIGIRIGVGLLMTLAVALAAWWTARMNTQSSTGLLYVGLGSALAGEISARVLFFLTGAAV